MAADAQEAGRKRKDSSVSSGVFNINDLGKWLALVDSLIGRR